MYNSGNSSKNVRGSNIIDGTVETVDIADDAVTVAKLDNAINTDIATGVSGSTTAGDALPKAGGTMTGDVSLGDNVKAKFGASDDLQIYHDGSFSFIKDVGTGSLYIDANDLYLRDVAANKYLTGVAAAEVKLYHNNLPKLATTATGIDVTGSVTCDGFTSTGIDDNGAATAVTINADNSVSLTTPVTNSSTYNGMKVQTASGTVANVTTFTQVAQFTGITRGTAFKLTIASGVWQNTQGYDEYIGYTGGTVTTPAPSVTYRAHAWDAYYQLVRDDSAETITINAYRGTDPSRLANFKIILLTTY